MSYGYSLKLAELNRKADNRSIGVQLGRVCIKRNIPVTIVAAKLRVSRQTIYNWRKIPPEKVPLVSELTGLPRWRIRPDLWSRRKAI